MYDTGRFKLDVCYW